MDALDLQVEDVAVAVKMGVGHKPSAVKLDAYPLLVFAPGQHGDGIRTEDNGTPIHDIAVRLAASPDLDAAAKHFKTTAEHIRQAHAYALAHLPS